MRTKLLWMLMAIFAVSSLAQTRSVSGTVYGAGEDEPLVGATVKVKGSRLATSTDIDGRFTINGLKPTDKFLEVTYVGYSPATVAIKPEKMKIYLNVQSEMLDEMIVVAFGKQKRESFTGSASVVDASQIARAQVTNPIDALNGNVTGLNMIESNSFGSDASITIRGIGSLNAGTEPLIVLDGLPYNGYFNDLNPADIESMTVLKDASSNALYGARGANGVILITSKSAKRGKTTVNFSAKWGANHDGRVKYDVISDPGQYYEAFYLAQRNYYINNQGLSAAEAHLRANQSLGLPTNQGGLGYMLYSVPEGQMLIGTNGRLNPNAMLGNRIENNGEIYTLYPDDWFKAGLIDGFRQEYNLTVSSANDKYSIYGSLGYLKDNGISPNNNLERITARLKAQVQLYSWLKAGAAAAYNHNVTNNNGGVFSCLTDMSPIYPLYIRDMYGNIMHDENGPMYDYGNGAVIGLSRTMDPSGNYIQEDLMDVSRNNSNAFNIQGFATADFLNGFHFTANANIYITENRMNYASNPYYGYNKETGGSVSTYHYRTTDYNTQQLLNYARNFGQHSVDVLLGHEYTVTGQTSLWGSKRKIALYKTNKELAGAIQDAGTNGDISKYNVEGYFLRAQYDFDSRYFFSGSFRRDGSSRFAKNHRWGNFWSLGAAWIMTKEEWWPKSPAIDMLKLKLSYGEQGNDNIGNFRYTNTYGISNSDGNVAFVFNSKGNEDITWETVGSLNAGLEFELFNSRLTGGLEFYLRDTRDMLMWFSTPLSLGYSGYYDNVGDMRNTGVELQLNADIIRSRAFTWNLGFNLTWERNRVTYLPEDKKLAVLDGHNGYNSGELFYGEGLPVNTWRMKRYAGVNEIGQAQWYYTDENGEEKTTTIYDQGQYYNCGTALPDLFGGINTTFKFFGVDVSAQFNYSIGGKKYDSVYNTFMTAPYESIVGGPIHRDIFKSWSPDNTGSQIPRWQYGEYLGTSTSDRFLTNASYFSIRNISVGYTFPDALMRPLHIRNLRVFCQAENVYYWTKRKGFDPRMGSLYGNYNSGSGYSFPKRIISGGLSAEF